MIYKDSPKSRPSPVLIPGEGLRHVTKAQSRANTAPGSLFAIPKETHPLAVESAQATTVGATRVLLAVAPTSYASVIIRNKGSVEISVGNATVTATTGFRLGPSDPPLSMDLSQGDNLYAITAAGSTTVDVLRVGA